MYRVVLYLSWVAFFVASSTVEAETLTVSFSGTVITVPSELSSTFFVSDPITGSFEIDSLSPDLDADPTIGLYIGPTNFSFEFGSYLATAPGGGGGDSVSVRITTFHRFGFIGLCGGVSCIAADVGAYFLTNMGLSLTDSTETAFSSDALPASLDINDFDSNQVVLIFQHATLPSRAVVGEISSVTLVPEPSTTGCDPAPRDTCLLAAKASLSIAEKKPGKEKLKAKLQAFDAATDQADFGDPVAGATRYDLCLYDAAGALAGELSVDRAGQTCGPKESSCFKDKGGNGWIYKDPAVEADGTKKIVIATGGVGKGKAQWQARNNAKKQQDAMPTGLTAALEGADTATLQLVASDGACFSATLDTVKTSDAESFKAKAP